MEDALLHAVDDFFGEQHPDGMQRRAVQGAALRSLLDASRDALMIVVGSRGRGGFAGLLLGSVSAKVAEHAECPVLIVRRPYAAALITLDAEALAPWKQSVGRPEEAGPAELRDDPDLPSRLQTAVDEANKTVSRAESIRRSRVPPVDLTEQNGYLTPTLKARRDLVHKDFAAEIEELYR